MINNIFKQKSIEELAQEMDNISQEDNSDLIEEEELEDDAENGYFYED